MIVDSMNLNEIAVAIRSDISKLESRILHLGKKYQSEILKKRSHKFPFTLIYSLISEQKIKFFFGFRAEKRSDWKNPNMLAGGTFILKDGQYGFLMCPNSNNRKRIPGVIIMTPHFLSRYRERMIKDHSLATEELIKMFIKNNHSFYVNEMTMEYSLQKDKYKREGVTQVSVISPEGYSVGEYMTNDCIRLMTFITSEMLSERQKSQIQSDEDYANSYLKILQMTGILEKDINQIKFSNKWR